VCQCLFGGGSNKEEAGGKQECTRKEAGMHQERSGNAPGKKQECTEPEAGMQQECTRTEARAMQQHTRRAGTSEGSSRLQCKQEAPYAHALPIIS
jgi:hypothetical protein